MKSRRVLFALFFFAMQAGAYAQCAMCKQTATSDHDGGSTNAESLNSGILYLMAIPYIIIMLGGYFFFKKQVDAKVLQLKNLCIYLLFEKEVSTEHNDNVRNGHQVKDP